MYSVEFAYNIVPSDEAGQGLSNLLIRQLAAIESGKGLQQAARSLGVSYRYFWGQIEIWEERFGQKLVIREQGKRARLSPLARSFSGRSEPLWRTTPFKWRRCGPSSTLLLPQPATLMRTS